MSFADWVRQSRTRVQEDGWRGVKDSIYRLYVSVLRQFNPLFNDGTNVYERDWDVLVVLDACRVDAIDAVADEFDFLDNPDTIRSVASSSKGWMKNTFTPEYETEIENTIYVTGNGYSELVSDEPFVSFNYLVESGWDEEHGTVPAETVTNEAIREARAHDGEWDRLIVHYIQPHEPSIPDPITKYDEGDDKEPALHQLRHGEVTKERVWESYMKNLRYVLSEVDALLDNVDADTVAISADHAEAFGELGVYRHPNELPLNCLREVPWYTTSATNNQTRTPEMVQEESGNVTEDDIEERLEALGYK